MKQGTVYWITGLSGAGKTTVGRCFYEVVLSRNPRVVFLDGDRLRTVYNSFDYSDEGRKKVALQHSRLCKMLSEQGLDVVCCVVSMYNECREWNRRNIGDYKEIYIKVPIEVLIRRNQKGIYREALKDSSKNVVGITQEFEEPISPDLVLENDGSKTITELLDIMIKELL